MLNWVWSLMMLGAIAFGILRSKQADLVQALLSGGNEAVALAITMAGGFALWCGLMEILEASGAVKSLGKMIKPALKRLFPGILKEKALSAITMNLTANFLGLGNAATPMGLKAMALMAEENPCRQRASRAMCMFLTLNSCCVQLIPSTVLTLRVAAGSQMPGEILWPTFLSTLASTVMGIGLCLWWGRGKEDE